MSTEGYKPIYPNGCELVGRWHARLTDSNGNLKQEIFGRNVVTTNGKEYLASFLKSAAAGALAFPMKYVAIGSDATAESAANTALGVELARTTGTVSYTSGAIYTVVATFAAGTGTGAVTEYGVFSASSSGTMLNRDTEAVINKGASDTLTVTCNLTFS